MPISKPNRSFRPGRLVDEDRIAKIVELIRHWARPPLTWECLRESIATQIYDLDLVRDKKAVKRIWSRQALSAVAVIKKAYDTRKVELAAKAKNVKQRRAPRDPQIDVLLKENEYLKTELKKRDELIAAYEDRFRTLLRNIHHAPADRSATAEEIQQALPQKFDRRPTDADIKHDARRPARKPRGKKGEDNE